MSETKILEGLELLKHLSLVFGPTGSEEAVADEIIKQLEAIKKKGLVCKKIEL